MQASNSRTLTNKFLARGEKQLLKRNDARNTNRYSSTRSLEWNGACGINDYTITT